MNKRGRRHEKMPVSSRFTRRRRQPKVGATDAEDVADTIADMRREVVEDLVASHIPERAYAEQWDAEGLAETWAVGDNYEWTAFEDFPTWASDKGLNHMNDPISRL